MRRILFALLAIAFLCATSLAQDSPSLGDLARQVRAQKQQKGTQSKDPASKNTGSDAQSGDSNAPNAKDATQKTSHVITDEEIPEHAGSTVTSTSQRHAGSSDDVAANVSPANKEAQGERWKSQIQAQKSSIAELQQEITSLNDSIRYAGANCVANCAQWNERQQQKQQQVENMKAQLEEQQHRLEEMQESARKQGFGSSIYDP